MNVHHFSVVQIDKGSAILYMPDFRLNNAKAFPWSVSSLRGSLKCLGFVLRNIANLLLLF